jgi:thiosulfate reductase cytochrome b subunit
MMRLHQFFHRRPILILGLAGAAVVIVALLMAVAGRADAQGGPPFHPTFPLLDAGGQNVLDSAEPVSTMKTCGACHDTEFIAGHSFHADVGLSAYGAGGLQPWDSSPGLFGRWDPLTYRYLSPVGDERVDLTTAEWLQTLGLYHAGGGPAVLGRDGTALADLPDDAAGVETGIVAPTTGALVPWDWQQSGTVEMNCFLCHVAGPNNEARRAALQAGQFAWANTATLAGMGIVVPSGDVWRWNEAAFTAAGELRQGAITIQDPTADNCGQCHGQVHTDNQTPLVLDGCETAARSTATTGQVFSPQPLANTGTNFADKASLTRSFDVHAERAVDCANCHYSLNNPVYYRAAEDEQLEHLVFDPRRIDLGEYLYRPLHQFAKGASAQSPLAPELDNTLRRCESCHDPRASHDWLPDLDRHIAVLGCETCHIPELYGAARQSNDWTVLTAEGAPRTECRGVIGADGAGGTDLFTGFAPALLPREDAGGALTLAPHNLITSWFWVYGDPPRPVPLRDLQAAWFDGDAYHADVLETFDANGDGALADGELVLDSENKAALIEARLAALGLDNPRIEGEVRPYTISHNVADGEWAIKDCAVCHSADSRLASRLLLAGRIPGGVLPTFVGGTGITPSGELVVEDGTLYYAPRHDAAGLKLYVFGHDSVFWVDALGAFMFLGVVAGVTVHSGLRYLAARRYGRGQAARTYRREYLYSVYERQWHWLQTALILLLLFTGLIIHKPDVFGMFSFRYAVQIHNVLAAILVINAALAVFYHLASGEIRQYLPEPHGFFGQAFAQALYYLRGIFRHEPHPFQKSPERKMNPLQQITYLAILNVLLPLQVITGLLMWGARTWPDVAGRLGGLTVLAPLHTLVAWSFAAFIVMHVYLTTTERTPLTGIQSMITGWGELETHQTAEEA